MISNDGDCRIMIFTEISHVPYFRPVDDNFSRGDDLSRLVGAIPTFQRQKWPQLAAPGTHPSNALPSAGGHGTAQRYSLVI